MHEISKIDSPFYRLSVVTPPTNEPVTTAEAKYMMRIEDNEDDERIAHLISVAREILEAKQNVTFLRTELCLNLQFCGKCPIPLPRPPIIQLRSASMVTILGKDAEEISLDRLRYDKNAYAIWPETSLPRGTLIIHYEAGYGDDAEAIPPIRKEHILRVVLYLYEQNSTHFDRFLHNISPPPFRL